MPAQPAEAGIAPPLILFAFTTPVPLKVSSPSVPTVRVATLVPPLTFPNGTTEVLPPGNMLHTSARQVYITPATNLPAGLPEQLPVGTVPDKITPGLLDDWLSIKLDENAIEDSTIAANLIIGAPTRKQKMRFADRRTIQPSR